MKSKVILVLCAASLISCGQQGFSPKTLEALKNVDQNKPVPSSIPQCEVNTYDYSLDTSVIAFEITSKAGLNFGFNLLSGFFKALGLSIQVQSGQMNMAMQLNDPVDPTTPVANALGGANMKKFNFDVNVDLVKAGGDINYYYQTPLSELTKKSLDNTIATTKKQLDSLNNKWSSKIVLHPEVDDVIIPVGSVAGIQLGDEFKIYNVSYDWAGAPCESRLWMIRKTPQEPIATAVAINVLSNATQLKIIQGVGEDISATALVEIGKLTNKRTSLKQSIKIGNIKSGKLSIDDKNEIDVVNYLKEEIKPVVRNYNFYIKE